MAAMDEFKDQRNAILKNGTLKQKLAYLWDYYKWPVIGAMIVIAILISIFHDILFEKKVVLHISVLNSSNLLENLSFEERQQELLGNGPSTQSVKNLFMEYAGINSNTRTVIIDTSMHVSFSKNSMEQMEEYLDNTQLDLIIAGDEIYEYYAGEGTFLDLRTVLTEEQLERYQSDLYYVDQAPSSEVTDPAKPELMKDPIPVGVYIDDCERFFSNYHVYNGSRTVLGFVVNARHMDNAVTFLEYLFSGE